MEEKKKSPEKKPYVKPELIELGSKETALCAYGNGDGGLCVDGRGAASGCTPGTQDSVQHCASGSSPS